MSYRRAYEGVVPI